FMACVGHTHQAPLLSFPPIDLIVKRKNYYPPILMPHLYVTAFAMNINKAQANQGSQNVSTGK
ncbi:MAG: hypothetical protein ABIP75_09860, partial [Pyrinomonadaceae bacterium]